MSASLYRDLLRAQGITQAEAARRARLTEPTVSRVMAGDVEPSPRTREALDQVLAFGKLVDDDEVVYVLARRSPPDFYLDARQLPGVFLSRDLATAVVNLLRQVGEPEAVAVPTGHSYARRLLTLAGRSSRSVVLSRIVDGPDRDGAAREPQIVAERAQRFVSEALQPVAGEVLPA